MADEVVLYSQYEVARRETAARYDDPGIVAAIKQTVAKGASDAQLRMFLEVCRRTGLDPFLKEVFFMPDTGVIMAARDGYLRVANEHPMFDGMETRIERDDKGVPIKAVCSVWRKDRSHPITTEAFFSEYVKNSPTWAKYKSAMIAKVAEAHALKRSFAINGVVSEDEIEIAGEAKEVIPVAVVTERPDDEEAIRSYARSKYNLKSMAQFNVWLGEQGLTEEQAYERFRGEMAA